MNNELRINPAFAGEHQVLSFAFIHRSLWISQNDSPNISTFTAHTLLKRNIGLGLILNNYNAGFYNNFILSIPFAYKINFKNEASLSLGISAGLGGRTISLDASTEVKDANDPVLAQLDVNTALGGIFGAGIYFETKNIDIGISSPELLKPQLIHGVNIANHLILYGKYKYFLNYNWAIYPSLILAK